MLAWSLWLGGSPQIATFAVVLWICLGIAGLLAALQVRLAGRVIARLALGQTLLEEFAKGNMTGRLEVPSGGDEIDEVALAVNKLGTSITGIIGEIHAANRTLDSVSKEFRERFEVIYGASEDMRDRSRVVATAAEDASMSLLSISAAAEEMSASVMIVASAMDAMSDATNEVARNCLKESRIATEAEQKAVASKDFMDRLGQSAKEIGRIISLISDIARYGTTEALKKSTRVETGGAFGHILYGARAAVEVLVILVMIGFVEAGFQTLVISSLVLVYARLGFAVANGGRSNALRIRSVCQPAANQVSSQRQIG